jgi:hypothetical protein
MYAYLSPPKPLASISSPRTVGRRSGVEERENDASASN